MIYFIDSESPDDNEVARFKELTHIPRIGEVFEVESFFGTVDDVVHDYTDGEDIYIYVVRLQEEEGHYICDDCRRSKEC